MELVVIAVVIRVVVVSSNTSRYKASCRLANLGPQWAVSPEITIISSISSTGSSTGTGGNSGGGSSSIKLVVV